MRCRYCSGTFAPGERRCLSCGAPTGPDTSVGQALLGQPSAAKGWVADFRRALKLSLGGTAVLIGLHIVFSPEDASTNALVIYPTLLWEIAVMPSILVVASVMSAKGNWATIGMNVLFSVLVWIGLSVALAIGLFVAYGVD